MLDTSNKHSPTHRSVTLIISYRCGNLQSKPIMKILNGNFSLFIDMRKSAQYMAQILNCSFVSSNSGPNERFSLLFTATKPYERSRFLSNHQAQKTQTNREDRVPVLHKSVIPYHLHLASRQPFCKYEKLHAQRSTTDRRLKKKRSVMTHSTITLM
jgi:hypothetical protein